MSTFREDFEKEIKTDGVQKLFESNNGNYIKWLEQKLNNNLESEKIIRKFLLEKSQKHKVELSDIVIGMQYGNLSVQKYNHGDYPNWKTLEEISFKIKP